jgi:hypothetical protein
MNPLQKRLKVVGIQYVPTPDADVRLSRAIDILLRSVERELERSIKDKKEEEPPQDSRPEKVVGQSDGEKG